MREITLLCVGRLKEKFYTDAVAEYVKRLSPFCQVLTAELAETRLPPRPSAAQIRAALDTEAQKILPRLEGLSPAQICALCVEGDLCTSEDLARRVQSQMETAGSRLTFLIGGSYGLAGTVKARAGWKFSLSPLTFPHHLARVILLEQLYRAFQIQSGSAYHK